MPNPGGLGAARKSDQNVPPMRKWTPLRSCCGMILSLLLLGLLAFGLDFVWNANTADGDEYRHRPGWIQAINWILPSLTLKEEWFLQGTEDDVAKEGLRVFLKSVEEDAGVTKLGKVMAAALVREQLTQRSCVLKRVNATRGLRPVTTASRPPIVVIGLPRTGTTFMHGLLGSHSSLRAPRFFEYMHSCGVTIDALNRRIQESKMYWLRKTMPDLRSIHFIGADSPEEDIIALGQEMVSMIFFTSFYVPGYVQWIQDNASTALKASLDYLKVFLEEYLRNDDRPWVLKTPWHLAQIDEFVESFPGTSFVWLHRDPVPTLSSMIDLVVSLVGVGSEVPKDEDGRRAIARYVVDTWFWCLSRGMEARIRLKATTSIKFVDVDFTELNDDPNSVATRVFDELGLHLNDEDQVRLRTYIEQNAKGKRGEHTHQLGFGLDADEIRSRYNAILKGIHGHP